MLDAMPCPLHGCQRDARRRLTALPCEPGVYLFRDARQEILYVGKAKSLRRRVRSYFRACQSLPFRTRVLVQRVRSVEALVVRTEHEALLLEARLIRSHRPRYNRRLKDGRGYPFLEIAAAACPPRVLLTDRDHLEGAVYFGPLPETGAIRDALDVIRRVYTQRRETFERPRPECLVANQRQMATELLDLLEGRSRLLIDRLEAAMGQAARALDFERAVRLREALAATAALARHPRARPGAAGIDLTQVVPQFLVAIADDA